MLFNRELLILHRLKFYQNYSNSSGSWFYDLAIEDILERLRHLEFKCKNLLDIGCRNGALSYALNNMFPNAAIFVTDISAQILDSVNLKNKIIQDEEKLDINQQFDLISYCMGMQWINNIENFLIRINYHLSPEGIFIGNFIGGQSFKKLRNKLIHLEEITTKKHSQHISPFIMFEHVAALFQQAGFKELIVDKEKVTLEYSSPLNLMRELNKFGESSKLNIRDNYSITKQMYLLLAEEQEFKDDVYIISFIACKNKGIIKVKSQG